MPFRIIREEFNKEYRSVVIDDKQLYEEGKDLPSDRRPRIS